MQAEADRRTAEALERLVEQVQDASKKANNDQTTAHTVHTVTSQKTQRSLRDETKEDIARVQVQLTEVLSAAMEKMQTESDRKAEVMLKRLEQNFNEASEQAKKSAASAAVTHTIPGSGVHQKLHSQPTQESQRTWANVTRMATQTAAGWTTIANRKKKPKKHPLDQRRILFVRNSRSHQYDPRDIMFGDNKALAHARADVTVRLIKMKYTEKAICLAL
jgi:hypothetical protein